MYNSYVVTSFLPYRTAQLGFARKALESGDNIAARKFLRTSLVLSYRRRVAKRLIRLGEELERTTTTPNDRKALDFYLAQHQKLWQLT